MRTAAPARPDIGHFYSGRDLEAMAFATNYHRWIAQEFRPFLKGKVIEVGAGSGNMTEMLLGGEVTHISAIEPSCEMFAQLHRRFGGRTECTLINASFTQTPLAGSESCDAIAYINVMEHIEDDIHEMQMAYSALKPGGHLLLFAPALPWLYSNFDRSIGHFRRYYRKELESLTIASGFEVVRSRYFDFAGIFPWFVLMVILRRSLNRGAVELYDRLVTPFVAPIERLAPPPLGKNILLVARKPSAPVPAQP